MNVKIHTVHIVFLSCLCCVLLLFLVNLRKCFSVQEAAIVYANAFFIGTEEEQIIFMSHLGSKKANAMRLN